MPALQTFPTFPAPPATLNDTQFRSWTVKAIVALANQQAILNANLQTIYNDTQRTIALLKGEE